MSQTDVTLTYYHNNDYSKPITITFNGDGGITASSSYWSSDSGLFDKERGEITFKTHLGKGIIREDYIDFGNGNTWHKDRRENLLFIGANEMYEIDHYVNRYNNALFIEAVPCTYERLKVRLEGTKKYGTDYTAVNALVTSEPNREYTFNVFNNWEASSSIYEPDPTNWQWSDVAVRERIKLISTTIEIILRDKKWESLRYDVVLDVQGAELEVLKGFGESNLRNIKSIKVEVSTKEFYKGGVLFDELNEFFVQNGFRLLDGPSGNHCDVTYTHE